MNKHLKKCKGHNNIQIQIRNDWTHTSNCKHIEGVIWINIAIVFDFFLCDQFTILFSWADCFCTDDICIHYNFIVVLHTSKKQEARNFISKLYRPIDFTVIQSTYICRIMLLCEAKKKKKENQQNLRIQNVGHQNSIYQRKKYRRICSSKFERRHNSSNMEIFFSFNSLIADNRFNKPNCYLQLMFYFASFKKKKNEKKIYIESVYLVSLSLSLSLMVWLFSSLWWT